MFSQISSLYKRIASVFFRRNELVLDDPVFGEIKSKEGEGFWSQSDLHRDVWVSIQASDDGPTEVQRIFFLQLMSRLDDIERQARSTIANSGVETEGLRIYQVVIGTERDCMANMFVVEYSDSMAEEIHRLQFRDGIPECYGIED